MDSIPTDVIGLFLDYLDTRQFVMARRVCKRWKEAFERTIWKHWIDVSSVNRHINNQDLQCLKGAKYINLGHCTISDFGIKYLCNPHYAIHTILLPGCRFITGSCLRYL